MHNNSIIIRPGLALMVTERGIEIGQIGDDGRAHIIVIPKRDVQRVVEALQTAVKGH